jgi:4-amino-4-deoxy-L-arabinose transferase-like glycosyltransferase
MASRAGPLSFWTGGRLAWAMGLAGGLAVLLTLGDPGITSDEPLDTRVGRDYLAALDRAFGGAGRRPFGREQIDAVFRLNKQHPPLGRLLLGLAVVAGEPFEAWLGGADPVGVHAARLAAMAAFAALVGLVVSAAGRRYGRLAGGVAGVALVMMPRVFAHGHFATLDTFLALFWTLALLRAERAVAGRRPTLGMAGAGLAWGLALLTKIHAWFLPPIVAAWALTRLRPGKAVGALAAWAVTGLLVFVGGWPWLWHNTIGRLAGFLETSVERQPLWVEYFGRVYRDRDVPWHYPWVYFAATVPVGLHALGVVGLVRGWRRRRDDPFPLLLAASIGLFLVVFSTRAPVYDGERLFLVVFPLWAILAGLGFATLWHWAGRRWVRGALALALAAQGYGVVAMHPFGLSYYNLLVGGLPGAERLGLELTYWGDAVDRTLLDDLARRARPGQVVAVAPTVHDAQAPAYTTSALHARQVVLQDESAAPRADWVVVYRRTAYWKPEIRRLTRTPPVVLRSRQGVWLSGLWRGPAP